jgi:hypothetical protein
VASGTAAADVTNGGCVLLLPIFGPLATVGAGPRITLTTVLAPLLVVATLGMDSLQPFLEELVAVLALDCMTLDARRTPFTLAAVGVDSLQIVLDPLATLVALVPIGALRAPVFFGRVVLGLRFGLEFVDFATPCTGNGDH